MIATHTHTTLLRESAVLLPSARSASSRAVERQREREREGIPVPCTSNAYLFNDNDDIAGVWKENNYTNGIYSGTFNNNNGKLNSIGYIGDWIEIKLPVEIKLTKIKFKQRLDFELRAPGDFRIYGSNDQINWEILINKSDTNKLINSDYNNLIYETTDIENNDNSYNTTP